MGLLDWFRRTPPTSPVAQYRDDRADPLNRLMTLIDASGNRVDTDSMELPQVFSFASIVQGANKSYLHGYQDEARRHSVENAKAMWRDPFLKGLLNERKRGVMACKWHLEPDNSRDPWQVATADALTKILKNIPRWRRIRWQLLNAIWYGKYAVQVDWGYKYMDLPFPVLNGPAVPGAKPSTQMHRCRVFTVRKTKPKNGDSIGWMHDDTPYIQVYAGWSHPGAEVVPVGGQGQGLVLRGTWRNRFIIHQHECEDAEFFDGDQAARHLGIGIRDELYWYDFVRRDYMSWVTKTLQRWGLGIIYIEYDYGNQASKTEAEQAAKKYSPGKSVLLVPRSWEPGRSSEGIKILEIPVAGMELLRLLQEKWEKVMERFVIGQHMSAGEADNYQGLGGNAPANFARETAAERVADDAENLAETLTGADDAPGFVNMIYRHTFQEPAGYDFPCPKLVFQTEDIDPQAKMGAIDKAAKYVAIRASSIYDAIGEAHPDEGEETVGGPQMMAPQAAQAQSPDGAGGEDAPKDNLDSLFADFVGPDAQAQYAKDPVRPNVPPRPATPSARPVLPPQPPAPPASQQRPATTPPPAQPPALPTGQQAPTRGFRTEPLHIPARFRGTPPPAAAPASPAAPQSQGQPAPQTPSRPMSQRLTETPQDAIEQHIRRSVQPHIEDATRLVDRPFDNNTPEQVVGWLRSIHSHPRMSDRHLHAIADHFGVQTRHLASRDDIVYRIGEAMRDRALSAGAPDIVTAEEVVDDDTPIDEPVAESLDDSDLENGVVEMPPPVQDTDTPHQPQTEQGRLVIESLRLIAHRLRHSGDPRHARHANQVTELISDLLDGEPLDARDVLHSLPSSAQSYPEWSVLADMAEAEEMAARASDDDEPVAESLDDSDLIPMAEMENAEPPRQQSPLPPTAHGHPDWQRISDLGDQEAEEEGRLHREEPMTSDPVEQSGKPAHRPSDVQHPTADPDGYIAASQKRLASWGVKSKEDFHGLVGKPRQGDNLQVIVTSNNVELFLKRADGTTFVSQVARKPDGKKVMKVHGFFGGNSADMGHAFGREDMRQMYDTAKKLGVTTLSTFGARGSTMIGYRIWPKMGFDGPLNLTPNARGRMPAALRNAKTLQDLYATPQGRKWWDKNGSGRDMTLELSGDGVGTRRFLEYIGVERSPERAARREERRRKREGQQ